LVEGLKTRLACWWPADSPDADGTGEVSKHYPQAEGTRPTPDAFHDLPTLSWCMASHWVLRPSMPPGRRLKKFG